MRYAVCGMRYAGSIVLSHSSCTTAAAQTSRLSSNYSHLSYYYSNSHSNYFSSSSPRVSENLTAELFAHGKNLPSLLLLQARLIALALTYGDTELKNLIFAAVVVQAFKYERG